MIVGRKDDRADPTTKLLDGIRLLELKEQAIDAYCAADGRSPGQPGDARDRPEHRRGRTRSRRSSRTRASLAGEYADKVLTVHSDAPDEALAELDKLEEPDSPYRIVISVGMLKEGWDVKNVYVIASMRA